MNELHALVDYENVQPTLKELERLAPGFTDVWLFHGPHQSQQATQFTEDHEKVTRVPRSGAGPNALDFHLSFYLGYVAARHPAAHLVVVANDKGYDPMIAHAKLLGFNAKRVGFKAKPTSNAKVARAKGAPKASAKKVVAKKTPAPVKAKPAAQAAAHSPDARALTRIQNGLVKMGNKAPHKLIPFLRHVGALLGKGSTAKQIDAMVAKLEKAGTLRVAGDLVLYSV